MEIFEKFWIRNQKGLFWGSWTSKLLQRLQYSPKTTNGHFQLIFGEGSETEHETRTATLSCIHRGDSSNHYSGRRRQGSDLNIIDPCH